MDGYSGVDAQQEDARSTAAARIQALLVAKRDALKERFEFINAMHDDGTITYDAVVEANELLLQAELELAPTKERRAEIHEKRIKNYQSFEKSTLDMFNAGTANGAAMQLAIANRIQAEIDAHRDAEDGK